MTPHGRRSALRLGVAAVTLAGAISCAAPGKFVWADDYVDEPPAPDKPFAIGPGDLLFVRVFNQEQISGRARVRGDGRISLPLLNDVAAAGLTPVALAGDLQTRFKDFIKNPLVTVSVEETRVPTIYVAGEVAKPGVYPLDSATSVLQAVVNAGGLKETASTDSIFVLRDSPRPSRIRFTYDALVKLRGKAPAFRLRAGDVVVVE